jgi:hypothetical protein
MSEFGKSAPWVTHFNRLEALFGGDPDVDVDYGDGLDGNPLVTLRVKGNDKADAIERIVRSDVEFGNVTVHVSVVPSNDDDISLAELIRRAFQGNEAFVDVVTARTPQGYETSYAVFEPEVVQYYDDDTSSLFGVATETYEQIAKEVLDLGAEAFICSDTI